MPTQSESNFVLGFYIQGLINAFTLLGGDTGELSSHSAIDVENLRFSSDRVPVETYLRLLNCAQNLLAARGLGLAIGQAMQFSSLSHLGQAIMQAKTLGHATELVLAGEGDVHRLGHSQIIHENGNLRFVWYCHYQQHPLAQTLTETAFANIISMAQSLAARGIPVLEATFVHPEPQGQLDAYRRCFRSHCFFSQPNNSLLLADEVLAWPIQSSVTATQTGNNQNRFSINALEQFLLSALAEHRFQLSHAAQHFNLSDRTLQRRLRQQHTSYQEILKQRRLRLGVDYLRHSDMGLHEISQLLGFKEQSSMNHFFTEQTGHTPSAIRQSNSEQIRFNNL